MQETALAPTPERRRHDHIVRLKTQDRDEFGRPAHPYRCEDILDRLVRDKAITQKMRQAADDFRRLFRRACLDPLRAPDLSRPVVDFGRAAPDRRDDYAARLVARALDAVGGRDGHAGSCLWHVVGCEMNLTEWADMYSLAGCPTDRKTARGVLIAALCPLARHFGLRD